jgi:hypothetical protein
LIKIWVGRQVWSSFYVLDLVVLKILVDTVGY